MNEIEIIIDGKIYRLTNKNNNTKYDRAKKEAGSNATTRQILAHYDKHLGYIQNEHGDKVENGEFWEIEKTRIVEKPSKLEYKTNKELQDIMRNSIDNSYIPSSIYNKAKQELEFRNSNKNNGIVAGGSISAGGDIIVNRNKIENKKVSGTSTKVFERIVIGVIITVVATGVVFFLGWN